MRAELHATYFLFMKRINKSESAIIVSLTKRAFLLLLLFQIIDLF